MFFGAVGQDKYSEILKLKANQEGVNVKYQYSSEKPTGNYLQLITIIFILNKFNKHIFWNTVFI